MVPFIIPSNFTIRGHVEIEVKLNYIRISFNKNVLQVLCHESASNITLHAADLTIQNDTITVARLREDQGEEEVTVTGVEYDEDREFILILTQAELERGASYRVTIDYTAYLKDNLKGFYR